MEKTFYIIDDHEMLRTGTASYIESHSGWKCRGNSGEGDAALAEFAQLAAAGTELPAVIICDLNFYGEDSGFDLIRRIRRLYPQQKIVVYSMFFAPGIVQNAMHEGAGGYVSKIGRAYPPRKGSNGAAGTQNRQRADCPAAGLKAPRGRKLHLQHLRQNRHKRPRRTGPPLRVRGSGLKSQCRKCTLIAILFYKCYYLTSEGATVIAESPG